MVGRGRGRGVRGNQNQQVEVAELRQMIEDLSRAVQALQRQERVGAHMETPEGDHRLLDIPEGDLEEIDSDENLNPFHDAGRANNAVRGGLEDRLVRALDLNGGVKIEVADFSGKMHVEDYLDWEATLENYFEWKPMSAERKVLFRVEEQHARQGKPKINTWEHMKAKLRKQFLSADYAMELYERFHSLKQRGMTVEEYTSEFNNLLNRVGLNERNEQWTARYLSGLNQTVRDELGIVRLFNLEDARQDALMAEKKLLRYGARRPISGRADNSVQKRAAADLGVRGEKTA
ncbi:hypothetical protein ACOSP7_010329 [Xanthoceras sorbifolium]